jgi:hypothetical protein
MLPCGNIVGLFLTTFLFSEPPMKQLLILCLACLTALPSQAARRVGEAEVRAGANGAPCFTISQHEEQRSGTPNFQAVTVTVGGDGGVLWQMVMPRERTFPVSFNMCVPYGGRVPALPQSTAAVLQEGTAYSVLIEARPGGNPAMPLRYQARFCLASGAGRSMRVQQLGTGAQSACRLPCGRKH